MFAGHGNSGFILNKQCLVFHPALLYHSNWYFAGGSRPFHYLLPLLNSAPACNIVLLQVGHDVVSFGCSTLSATVPADGMLTGFLLLSSTFKTIQALAPGGRFSNTPPDSNTCSLQASAFLFASCFQFIALALLNFG